MVFCLVYVTFLASETVLKKKQNAADNVALNVSIISNILGSLQF